MVELLPGSGRATRPDCAEDVDPALAVGMAAKHGWLVTLCTELHWRDFVLKHAADVPATSHATVPCTAI